MKCDPKTVSMVKVLRKVLVDNSTIHFNRTCVNHNMGMEKMSTDVVKFVPFWCHRVPFYKVEHKGSWSTSSHLNLHQST